MTIFGIDCSDFDWGRGPMDVAAMARDGISFLTHKATEGTRTQHTHYGEALNRAQAAGVPCIGAYMVPRTPGNNGHGSIAAQVAYFLAYLDAQTPWWRAMPTFFLQVDTEHWGYDDVAPTYGAQACELLRAQTGKWVAHYAPNWAYGNTIPGNDPLWASSYGGNPAVPYRQAYPGDGSAGWNAYSGRTPTILQYGSATVIGGQSTCDANAFRGSIDEFRTMITGGTAVSFTPEQESDIYRAVTELTETKSAIGVAYMKLATSPGWGLFALSAKLDADGVRDKAMAAAIDGLVAVVKAGGGSVDAAPIIAAISTVHDDATAQFTALHAENAKLRAIVDEYAAREARAAKAEADALNPPAPMAMATTEAPPAPPVATDPETDGDPATGSPGTTPSV